MEYQVTGTVLERYLSEHGITAYDFCKKYNLDVRTYDSIVRGEKVGLTTLFVIAHRIGLSLNDFLT